MLCGQVLRANGWLGHFRVAVSFTIKRHFFCEEGGETAGLRAAGEAGSGGQLDVGRGVACQAIGKLAAAADGSFGFNFLSTSLH